MNNLIGEEFHATLKLNDDKKYPEDNDGVETERSNKSERLMRRQIELMIEKMRWNEFGVVEMVKLDELRADQFGEYVCTKRKRDGSLYKKRCYLNLQSSLTHLFNIYKKKKSEEFKENLSEIMTELKKVVTECMQQGEGTV
jgi:hypothetical protein